MGGMKLKNIIRKSGEVIDTKPFDTIFYPSKYFQPPIAKPL